MRKIIALSLMLFVFLSLPLFGQSTKEDFYDTLEYSYKASCKQFTAPQAIPILALSTVSVFYAVKQDNHIEDKFSGRSISDSEKTIGVTGLVLISPASSMLMYFWGRQNADQKFINFTKEYFAAINLSIIESTFIGFVPFHGRPDGGPLNPLERRVGVSSSFPSGHPMGYMVLSYKLFQFYGPQYSVVPAVLAYVDSRKRLKDRKHYLSDVVGSAGITLLASEGVRVAANNHHAHPIYQWIFDHEVKVGAMVEEKKHGFNVSLSF